MKAKNFAAPVLFILTMMAFGTLIGLGIGAVLGLISGVYELYSFGVVGSIAGLILAIISIIGERKRGQIPEVKT